MRVVLLLSVSLLLGACGFHMRGHNGDGFEYPFHKLYLKVPADTPFATELRLNLELNKVTLVSSSAEADLILDVVSESASKQIIALSGAGQVRELELRYRVSLRAYDNQQHEWLSADEIQLQRSLTYDDSQQLAKEQEELMLYNDMRSDAVQQVMRRLARAKPRTETGATAQ